MSKSTIPNQLSNAGKCRRCKKPRVINMQKGVPIEEYLDDRFCSARCARLHHGNPLETDLKASEE